MLQDSWSWISSLPQLQIFAIAYGVFISTYWSVALLFLSIDLIRPAWASRFKCQIEKKPRTDLMVRAARNVVLNQLTTYPACFLVMFPLAKRRLSFSEELPTAGTWVLSLIGFALLTEFFFFWVHRTFHTPFLYRHVHKIHHEVKAPFGFCALYFHPIEHVMSAIQGIAPAFVLGSHVSIYIFWTFLATAAIVVHHSGYNFEPYILDSIPPFKSMTHQHDYHHFAFDRCFGVIGIMDWFHGTDRGFEEHIDKWEQKQSDQYTKEREESQVKVKGKKE